jgi:FAD/FMN-containing dehydrogenase
MWTYLTDGFANPQALLQVYYLDNYPALQQVKAVWDPNNIFNHQQSVRLPG